MKKNTLSLVLASALLSMTAAQASEFNGGYVDGKVGYNNNSPATTATSNAAFLGGEVGYGWDVNQFMLGVDGFGDSHKKSITGRDYGADVKLGYPMGKWMPYAKLGATGSNPGTRPNGALGVEYKFAPHWSVLGEVFADSKSVNGVSQKNTNAAIGLSYYFNTPYVAPVVAAVAAPVVMQKPAPVVAPAPVAAAPAPVVVAVLPAAKTIFTDKPITIEGASFSTNSAKLKPTAHQQLEEVVAFAAKYPEANLAVDGYTDSRGSEKLNRVLSAKRAAAVKAYLVKKGVDAKRISTAGNGSAKPVGDNKTEAGRAQNRRVEINSVIRVAK